MLDILVKIRRAVRGKRHFNQKEVDGDGNDADQKIAEDHAGPGKAQRIPNAKEKSAADNASDGKKNDLPVAQGGVLHL